MELDAPIIKEICGICTTQFSKYKCPKCNINYCSLNCYKSQSHADCSEIFYKDCVIEELSQQKGSAEGKRKMLEILERCGLQEDEEETIITDELLSLEERLTGIDIDSDPDGVWNNLTKTEKRQFHEMFQNGTLAELVSTTSPWWETIPKIQELNQATPITETTPRIPSTIPKLSSLIKVEKISPCVPNNIINILYSYVYTMRLYNSSIHELPVQSTKTLIELSAVLSSDISFSTVHDAIQHSIGIALLQQHTINSRHYALSIVRDVSFLMERSIDGILMVVYALCDVLNVLGCARKALKQSPPSEGLSLKRLLVIRKKLEFLISWSLEKPHQLKSLIQLIRNESQENVDIKS